MKKKKITEAINSNAVEYLKSLISPNNKILDLYIKGKWLMAELSSGCRFGVKNKSTD